MYDRKKSDMGSDGRAVDGGSGTAGGTFMEGTTYFDAPVPLERVDHVLFGDIRVELE